MPSILSGIGVWRRLRCACVFFTTISLARFDDKHIMQEEIFVIRSLLVLYFVLYLSSNPLRSAFFSPGQFEQIVRQREILIFIFTLSGKGTYVTILFKLRTVCATQVIVLMFKSLFLVEQALFVI